MKRSFLCPLIAMALVACGDNADDTTALEEMIEDLEAEVADLSTQLAQLQQDLATRTGERDALKTERDMLAGDLDELEASLQPSVTLTVPLRFGSQALALDTAYAIGNGDTISFHEIRYWLSNVALQKSDQSWVTVPDAYYLVEARKAQALEHQSGALELPAKRRESIELKGIPAGTYVAIKFNIGVDAPRNGDHSNVAGELNAFSNMASFSWMWFTSYRFTRTRAALAGTGGDAPLSWENGANDNLREVELDFPAAQLMTGTGAYAIELAADVEALVAEVPPRANLTINATTADQRTALSDAFRDMFAMVSVSSVP